MVSKSVSALLPHHEWYDLLCCTDMHCSLFIFYFLTTFIWFFIISFLLFIPFIVPFRHLYTFPIWHLSSWSTDGLTTSLPFSFHHRHSHGILLSSMAQEIFSMHYIICEGMDLIIGYLSFSSFLSPYHPGLRYVPRLKTTLRLWDQTLSLTVFTWTGFCRLVEVKSLLCFLLWEILLEALGFSLLLGISMFDGFFWVWRQSIDDIRFVILLCIKCPH